MPVNIGARLGPYEILALLGKGGLGEVFHHDIEHSFGNEPKNRRPILKQTMKTQLPIRFQTASQRARHEADHVSQPFCGPLPGGRPSA